MPHTRFRPDRGLTARMLLTMLVLTGLYMALSAFLFSLVGSSGSWVIWLVLPMLMLWGQWYFSDQVALRGMGGRIVSPAQAPELHAMVDRLCALADMPKPQVAVSHSRVPNAFATGRSPQRAVVCVTAGLLERLNDDELEAVLAHELSHVAHRDVTVMTAASAVGVLAGFIMNNAFWVSRDREDRESSGAAVYFATVLIGWVVYAISHLLTMLLSRYRELSADRSGAILIGQPAALASALVKISGAMDTIPTRDLRQAAAFNAFFLTPAASRRQQAMELFSSHPPLEKRLAQLEQLSRDLGRPF